MDVLFDIAALVLAGLAIGDVAAPQWFHPGRAPDASVPVSGDTGWSQHLFLELAVVGSLLLCLILGPQLSATPLGRGLAGFVSAFWVLRLVLQVRLPSPASGALARLTRATLIAASGFLAVVFALAALASAPAPSPDPGVAPVPPPAADTRGDDLDVGEDGGQPEAQPVALAHWADGHTHGGLFPAGHDHEHGDELAPDQVPIVRFEPRSNVGPRGGVVSALSTPEEADVGFAEVKWDRAQGRVQVWLAKDRGFREPLELGPDAAVQLYCLLAEPLSFALRAGARAALGDPYAAGGAGDGESARKLESLPPGTLARVLIEDGGAVHASDDLELGSPGR